MTTQNIRIMDILQSIHVEQKNAANAIIHVKVENLNMPFWALVGFLVKVSIASIPAAIIFASMVFLFMALFGGILGIIGLSAAGR